MKKFKSLYKILAGVVIAILVVAVLIGLFVDAAVKMGIEKAGTKELKVAVKVDSADLSILRGGLELNNVTINNPAGYQFEKMLELKNANVAVDTGSLLSDMVNIKYVRLDGVNVVLEQKGIGKNNLQEIMSGIEKKEKPEKEGKKLHIDKLEITDITVNAKLLPIPGKQDTVTLKIAPITMTDLGGDKELDTAKLTGIILAAIAKGIAEQGAGLLPGDMVNSIKSGLGDFEKVIGEQGQTILKQGQDIQKGVTEGLKGIFKPKDSNK